MNEIITVTGKGKISLPPDTIIINIYSEPVNYDRAILCEESACSYESSLDIEPEDLDITDTVTVTWEILL